MVKIPKKALCLAAIILLLTNFFLWRQVLAVNEPAEPAVYFLNVGQGDSQLVMLGAIKVLIDGGKGRQALRELKKLLPPGEKYLDLIILSHANIDHYGGLVEIAKYYQIGALIYNGKDSPNISFEKFKEALKNTDARLLVLLSGDRIKYRHYRFLILSPDKKELRKMNDNEASLVVLLETTAKRVLFTGDIGRSTEERLAAKPQIKADILKVPHHGSVGSLNRKFVTAVSPEISVIEVGRNSYGHPSGEFIKLLAAAGSLIYRTDIDGTVKISLNQKGKPPPRRKRLPPSYQIRIERISSGSAVSVTDEYIQLFNAGKKAVDLKGWTLKKQTVSGREYTLVSRRRFKGIISPGGRFLIAHRNYRGKTIPDLFYSNKSNSLAAKGNVVVLYDSGGNIVARRGY